MTRRPLMAFHYPAPLAEAPSAGSQVRPARMLAAFEELGYEVAPIVGRAAERKRAMAALKDQVTAHGRRLELCYGESTTMPTALTEPHHLPTHPTLDAAFFRWLRRTGVPSGLFYRDVYWRFPQYHQTVPIAKRAVAVPAYYADLWWYRHWVDVVFVPSLRMANAVPGLPDRAALPPGCVAVDADSRQMARTDASLRLFYVGSVTPPTYDIRPLLDGVRAVPEAALTVCCPASERSTLDALGPLPDDITVVHRVGAELEPLYANSDVACLVFARDAYRAFAMPIKLFEALGHGRPVLASGSTAVADFIRDHDLGWTADDAVELTAVLRRLAADPAAVERKAQRVRDVRPAHTWTARARQVVACLRARDRRSGRVAAGSDASPPQG